MSMPKRLAFAARRCHDAGSIACGIPAQRGRKGEIMDIVALVLWILYGVLRLGYGAYQLLNVYAENVPLLLEHWLFSAPADMLPCR